LHVIQYHNLELLLYTGMYQWWIYSCACKSVLIVDIFL